MKKDAADEDFERARPENYQNRSKASVEASFGGRTFVKKEEKKEEETETNMATTKKITPEAVESCAARGMNYAEAAAEIGVVRTSLGKHYL